MREEALSQGCFLRLALIACLLVLACASIHGEEQTNQPSQEKQKGANPPQAQASPGAASTCAIRQPTAEPVNNRKAEKQTYIHHVLSPEILPNWLLCVVGVAGVILAWRTLKDLTIQTKALNISAEAANKNAEASQMSVRALANIYRAWVLFVWEYHPSKGASFTLSIKNWGQTPAKLDLISITCKVLTEAEVQRLNGLTDKPPAYVTAPMILAPSKSFILSSHGDAGNEAGKEWDRVFRGEKMVVWYGVVLYRDVLTPNIEHRTRFCYCFAYNKPGLHGSGHPGSNGNHVKRAVTPEWLCKLEFLCKPALFRRMSQRD